MFKRILIPTDGSEFGEKALAQGLDLAKVSGGEVTLLYALEDPTAPYRAYTAPPPEYSELLRSELRSEAETTLKHLSARAKSLGVCAKTLIIEEHPVTAILEAAKNYDLVVMATHNRKGIDRVMMGSVTDKVLHNCSTPVLVVRG